MYKVFLLLLCASVQILLSSTSHAANAQAFNDVATTDITVTKTKIILKKLLATGKAEHFLPLNNASIPVSKVQTQAQAQDEINKEVFITVLTKVFNTYAADFAARGLLFQPVISWEDPEFNAFTFQQNNTAYLVLAGGLARFPGLTADGLALIACHEIGHNLGGLPSYNDGISSTEGEADYFATTKCLRRVFALGDTFGTLNRLVYTKSFLLDPFAQRLCEQNFASPLDKAICVRTSMAAKSVATVFAGLSGLPLPRFSTPDRRIAPFAIADHPPAQCRLDTYLQGALCGASIQETFSLGNVSKGACTPEKGYKTGFRPLCWFSLKNPPAQYWIDLENAAKEKMKTSKAPKVLGLRS